MDQEFWVNRFSCDLDKILEKNEEVDLEEGDDQYNKTLYIAKTLKSVDFSNESKVKDKLKQQLLKKIEERKEKDELSDEELDNAAGGIGIDWSNLKDEKNND